MCTESELSQLYAVSMRRLAAPAGEVNAARFIANFGSVGREGQPGPQRG